MNIAIDISPLSTGHKVRGTGFYLLHLKNALIRYFPQNSYTFFSTQKEIPENAEIIHYPYFEPFFLTLPVYKKKKTIVTVHDLTPLVFPKIFPVGIKGTIKWYIQRLSLRLADAIITDSQSSRDDIEKFAGISLSKIHVVYLAAGEEFIQLKDEKRKEEIRKKYKLPEKFALYVGDITPNKNVPRIVEAAIAANIPLVLVGKALAAENLVKNSWNDDLVRMQKAIRDKKNIFLLGFIPTDDLVLLYNSATVLFSPSLYEGFGLPIVEAMSCGCPVITSHQGSLAEIAEDAVEIVDPYSQDAMQKVLEKVFNDKKLQESLSKRGLQQVKKFSWKKTAEETIKVYEEVLANK
ncbi:MAG: glycosyltransferase family 4 protein [Candidatus Levyibacteriota bacterium]